MSLTSCVCLPAVVPPLVHVDCPADAGQPTSVGDPAAVGLPRGGVRRRSVAKDYCTGNVEYGSSVC